MWSGLDNCFGPDAPPYTILQRPARRGRGKKGRSLQALFFPENEIDGQRREGRGGGRGSVSSHSLYTPPPPLFIRPTRRRRALFLLLRSIAVQRIVEEGESERCAHLPPLRP